MTITVKKCDGGVPLPEGSTGTWFTWDTWDEEAGRSISRHRTQGQAEVAAETLRADLLVRDAFEEIMRRTHSGPGPHDSAILDALVYVRLRSAL